MQRIAILLVLVLTVGLVGCGKVESDKNEYISMAQALVSEYNLKDANIRMVYKGNSGDFKLYDLIVESSEFQNLDDIKKFNFVKSLDEISVIGSELIVLSNTVSNKDIYKINKLYDNVLNKNDSEYYSNGVKQVPKTYSSLKNNVQGYMEKYNINLTAKDVQYDMVNNLDKKFVITGTAKLDDYYNYGFDDSIEKDYFVARVTPEGGSYSESWYLYFHRESFKELFNEMKKHNVDMIVTAEIPKYRFKRGQGNMAEVKQVRW